MNRSMFVLGLGTLLLIGCGARPQAQPRKPYPPPYPIVYPSAFLPISPARASIVPRSQFMKVAVLNFVDQTGKSERAVEAIADMLSTELHSSGRFEIYDRLQLRAWDASQLIDQCKKVGQECKGERMDTLREQMGSITIATDAIVLGAITASGGGSLRVDYRLINSTSGTVMVAGQAPIAAEVTAGGMKLDREAVQRLAQSLKSALPKPEIGKFGRVLVQDGIVLTVNLGRNEGIIPGMNIFVVDPGRGAGGAQALVDETYLAQAYVVSVYENSSQVVVFDGSDFRVGDYVRFK